MFFDQVAAREQAEADRARAEAAVQVRFSSILIQFQFNFNSILIRFNRHICGQLRRKKGGAKHVVNICCGVCIVFLFGITWIVSSTEQMCTSSPALVGLKVELVVRRTITAATWLAFFEECQQ